MLWFDVSLKLALEKQSYFRFGSHAPVQFKIGEPKKANRFFARGKSVLISNAAFKKQPLPINFCQFRVSVLQ